LVLRTHEANEGKPIGVDSVALPYGLNITMIPQRGLDYIF